MKHKYSGSHPDEPVILHRKELVNKKPPFDRLRDPVVEQSFNADLLRLLDQLQYVVMTVVIDKLEHQQRYRVWKYDPYHYCLAVLVERYVLWLGRRGARGDVMAESRGGREDERLKRSFARLFTEGTEFVPSERVAASLTSSQLKVKPKSNNISGLQLADVIAHPSYSAMLAQRGGKPSPSNFGSRIVRILEVNKLDRSPNGSIEGWGRKWLP